MLFSSSRKSRTCSVFHWVLHVASLVMAASCFLCCQKGEFATSQGLVVVDHDGSSIRAWQADLMADYLIEELGRGEGVLSGVEVHILADITHPQGGKGKRGYADIEGGKTYIAWDPSQDPCVATTSFIHELVHIIQYEEGEEVDYKHESEDWDRALIAKYRAQITMCAPEHWDELMPNHMKIGLKCHRGE